ncbi:hypothetical protein H4219_005439, partial [Mycoemilia scoparia]
MAANMVTLLGFLHVILAYAINIYMAPGLSEELPSWVYYVYAACVWIYGSFDAVDGKQARRTGTSSPLGEMFDHGCDSLAVTLLMLLQATSMGLGQTWWTVAFISSGLTNFYMSTMEEYHTHTLYLGYFSGPVEGIIMATTGLILTGTFGQQIWHNLVRDYLPLPGFITNNLIPAINFGQLVVVLICIGLIPTVIASLDNIAKACRTENKSVLGAYADATPLAASLVAIALWLHQSPSLLYHNLTLFLSFTGLTFSYIVGRVIIAHVTKAPFPKLNRMHIPIFLGAVNSVVLPRVLGIPKVFDGQSEVVFLWGCLVYSLLQYGHFVYSVIEEI